MMGPMRGRPLLIWFMKQTYFSRVAAATFETTELCKQAKVEARDPRSMASQTSKCDARAFAGLGLVKPKGRMK